MITRCNSSPSARATRRALAPLCLLCLLAVPSHGLVPAHPRRPTGLDTANLMPNNGGGGGYPGESARGAAAMSHWDLAPGGAAPVGLLHPTTINLLRDYMEADPVMSDFLHDFDLGGPMQAMKHLSNSHVTSRLVAMTAELNVSR